jgi:hypothetical protein
MKPEHRFPHDDFPALASAVDQVTAALARVRDDDGEPDPDASHAELWERLADLIEVGRTYDDVNTILSQRILAARRGGRVSSRHGRRRQARAG